MAAKREFVAGRDDAGRRLDRVLRVILPDAPLSAIYGALRRRRITLNGGRAKPDDRLKEGDRIAVDSLLAGSGGVAEAAEAATARPSVATPSAAPQYVEGLEKLKDLLVFAGDHLLFLNKPRGTPSHGEGGLDLLVREALASRSAASLSFSPGPLHRLDRNTSGLIAFPRSAEGARAFTALLREGGLRKRYLALVEGEPGEATMAGAGGRKPGRGHGEPGEEVWEDRLLRDERIRTSRPDPEGKAARARAKILLSGGGYSLLLVTLETGLTHQIRAQAAARGRPLAGDAKYGGKPFAGGYILHAWLLDFTEPLFPDLPLRLEAPLPSAARGRLETMFGAEALSLALAAAR